MQAIFLCFNSLIENGTYVCVLRLLGTLSGEQFYHFPFFIPCKWGTLEGKNLLPLEQSLFFKSKLIKVELHCPVKQTESHKSCLPL